MTKRRLFALLMAALLLTANLGGALAQDATPGATGPSKLARAGLPELTVKISATGLEVPAEVAAGTVLLVVDNQAEGPAGVSVVQLPEGVSMEEAMALFGPPPADEGGTPEAAAPDAEGTPGAEEGGLPPLFFDMTWAGGAFAFPGARGEAAINLTAGQWLVVPDPTTGLAPTTLTVTAGAGAAPEIAADVTIEMTNFQFALPAEINAGDQIWKLTNSGDQPHEMVIMRTPQRLTLEQVQTILDLPEGAEPPAGVPNPADFEQVGGAAPISANQAIDIDLNLAPGAYIAVCFMPDKEKGMPHALEGMVVVFEVAAEGQTVAPPASPEPMAGMDMGTPAA